MLAARKFRAATEATFLFSENYFQKILTNFDLRFVIYKVLDLSSTSETTLYAVEFHRHPRDLGVVVVLLAENRVKAIEQVRRLYPEYKRNSVSGCVYPIQYAEIDWDNGRAFAIRRKTRPTIPKPIPGPVAGQSETQEEEND